MQPVQRQHRAVGHEPQVEGQPIAPDLPATASAHAAIAERPSTIATGDKSSQRPNNPAKPNSSTAACTAPRARARVMDIGASDRSWSRIVTSHP
jgi:hypothetical protein